MKKIPHRPDLHTISNTRSPCGQGKACCVVGTWMAVNRVVEMSIISGQSRISPSFLGQCGLMPPLPASACLSHIICIIAFQSVACEPLVGFEINAVGHDQHFYKKRNRITKQKVLEDTLWRTSVDKHPFVHRHPKPLCTCPVGQEQVAASPVDTDLFKVSRDKLSLCAQLILKI